MQRQSKGCRLLTCCILLLVSAASSAAHATGSRNFQLVNNCTYPVWFGFAGGSVPTPSGGQCGSDSDCYAGAACVQTGTVKQCFWRNPRPANGDYELAANGGTNSVTIPASNGSEVWSGIVSGRVGCSGGTCAVADCGNDGSGGCLPSRGFGQPATQAEFTLSFSGLDFYDVEVINGVSLPISMAPVQTSTMSQSNGPYFCGTPGAVTPSSSLLGGCSWNFTPPSNDYRWVTAGGGACNQDSDCRAGALCGISFNPGQASLLQKTCGTTVGWWTADEICGIEPNYGAPFNCAGNAGPVNMATLYACAGVGSCYQPGASNTCCGCVNWDQAGVNVPGAAYTQQCVNSNPTWTSNVQPKLQWLKEACPTAYTYPYDDMSSTFTCSDVQAGVNTVNYVVTFCPGASSTPPPTTPPPTTPPPTTPPPTTPPPTTPPPAPGFTQSVAPTGAQGQVQVTFTASSTAQWVVLHYNVKGSGQENVTMTSSDDLVWTWDIDNLNPGDTITYSFTYWIGNGATDSDSFTYTMAETTSSYTYEVYLAANSNPVSINGNPCASGSCAVQADAGSAVVVAGRHRHRCSFTVGPWGTLSLDAGQPHICASIYTSPASSNTTGVIALPFGF